jgi:hypothetical protein
MVRATSTNYTAAGEVFEYASVDADPILPEDIWLLAKAFHNHTHESTRGAAVRRIETASAPGSAGQVQISSDNLRWWGTGSSAIFTAASLTGAETFTNKTLVTPTIASFTNAQHNHSNAAAGGTLDGAAIASGITGTGNVVKATSPTIATPTITAPTMTTPVVSSGGIAVTGNSTITGTLGGLTGLTVASGGIAVTGNSTIAGTLGSLTGLTLASGQVLLPIGSAALPSLYFDSGNGIYSQGTDRLGFATAGVVRTEINAAGNLGVGVVPNAWDTAYRAVQVGTTGGMWGDTASSTAMRLSSNTYADTPASNRSIITGASAQYVQSGGNHYFFTAGSVVAGNLQTFSERLQVTLAGDVLVPNTASGTMTDGFIYIPSAGNPPSGVPTNRASNRCPLYYDSTTNRLWVYSGATGGWKFVALA